MKIYEFNGEKYKSASRHQKEWGNALIGNLALHGNESILDLGCGDGTLTYKIAHLVPNGNVLGIDSSLNMICSAREYSADNLLFVNKDINNIDYNSQFDIIFSNAALHWVTDHKNLLTNCYKALKPGGKILWNFAASGNCQTFFSVIKEEVKEKKYKKYFDGFEWPWYMPEISEYEKLLEQSRFKNYTVEEQNRDRYFKDGQEMTAWIDQPSLVPFLAYLPEQIRRQFRNEVVNKMLELTLQPDLTCFETFRRINVFAVK